MRRIYENALRLLETRRRRARPKSPATAISTIQDVMTNKQNSLKGVPSLVGMKEWLRILGHTTNSLNIIHISGTKGKGSACAFTRGLLRAHTVRPGFPKRIGLYTGPSLQCIRERIQIGDHPVPEDLFSRYFFEVWDRIMPQDTMDEIVGGARQPRYLQLLALLAFHTFISEEVDAAIFEVHHGGEYDATNVIQDPVVTGIASLGMDHVAQLGPTIETIAWHKAGIFKSGAPAFSVTQEPGPAEVMRKLDIIEEGKLQWFVDGAHNILSLEQAAEWFARNAPDVYKCRALIFSHLSEERDGVTLVRSLAHALFKSNVKPDYVIFTTYQEKDDKSIDQSIEDLETPLHDRCAMYSSVWKELDPQAMVTSEPTIESAVNLARQIRAREDGMQALITGSLHMVGGALRFLRP